MARNISRRMTLELTEREAGDLGVARDLSGLGTSAKTLRTALRVFAALLREEERGGEIWVIRESSEGARITLPKSPRDPLGWIEEEPPTLAELCGLMPADATAGLASEEYIRLERDDWPNVGEGR